MSQYQKPCIFCKQEIKMSDNSGKWLPYNLDGSLHECKDKEDKPQVKKEQVQSQQEKKLTLEDLDIRLKKIEALLYVDD